MVRPAPALKTCPVTVKPARIEVRRRSAALVAAAGLAGLAVAAAPASATSGGLRFSKPVTRIGAPLGQQKANTGEPRLQLLPSGRILLAAHFEQWDCTTGRPSSQLSMCVWASDDGGRSFYVSGGDPQPGDDADFAVAPDGSVLELGMTDLTVAGNTLGTGLGGTTAMHSSDGGRTWTETDDANRQALNDRPFLVSTPHAVLMSYSAIPGNIEVVRSTDGGRTFGLPISVTPPPWTETFDGNGGPAFDSVAHQVLLPYFSSTDPTCASAPAGCFNVLSLATSSDEGLTWTTQTIGTAPSGGGLTSMPQITVDADGHRYLTYPAKVGGHNHIYVQDAAGPGAWSPPRLIDSAHGNGMVGWTWAGGHGHLDVAYYRSTATDAVTTARPWDLVVADSRDGGHTWQTATVERAAYTGSADAHQLVVWDLLGLIRDRHGHLVVAWTDDRGRPGSGTVIRTARSR